MEIVNVIVKKKDNSFWLECSDCNNFGMLGEEFKEHPIYGIRCSECDSANVNSVNRE